MTDKTVRDHPDESPHAHHRWTGMLIHRRPSAMGIAVAASSTYGGQGGTELAALTMLMPVIYLGAAALDRRIGGSVEPGEVVGEICCQVGETQAGAVVREQVPEVDVGEFAGEFAGVLLRNEDYRPAVASVAQYAYSKNIGSPVMVSA